MSLVLYGNGIVDARGSVGGTTLSRSRGGASQRAKISPTQTRSEFRQISKGVLSTVSQRWENVLTAVERAAWNAFAVSNPSTNVFGQVVYLSGHMWFCKCNINLLSAGAAAITSPPISAGVPGPITFGITADSAGAGSISYTFTDAGQPADCYLKLRASGPVSVGITYANNIFRQIEYAHTPVSGTTVTTPYNSRFPGIIYSAGKQVFGLASFMDGASGIESPALIATAIVT